MGRILAALLVMAATPATAYEFNSNMKCVTVRQIMDSEDKAAMKPLGVYIIKKLRQIDDDKFLDKMSQKNMEAMLAMITVSCGRDPNVRLVSVIAENYDGFRELHEVLLEGKIH